MSRCVPLTTLVEQVAREQDRALDDVAPIAAARARFERYAVRRARREPWVLAACVAAGALAAGSLLLWYQVRPLGYETERLEVQPVDSANVLRSHASEGAVRFSDGSGLQVGADATVRIESVNAHGAVVRLDHGSLLASVVHTRHSEWTFLAGPFEVEIIGTSFELTWDARDSTLNVSVREGAIRVSGCSVGSRMYAGQRATLRCVAGQPEMNLSAVPPSPSSASESAPPSQPVPSPESRPSRLSASGPRQAPPQPEATDAASAPEPADAGTSSWREHAAAGRMKDAYAAAARDGFEKECGSASARDLLDLADGALLSGRVDHATFALMQTRSKHAGTAAASTAAYKLGRIAFDQRGALGDARAWFQAYLQEAPAGTLAREAAGRLIEIDLKTGNQASAKDRAKDYLQRWPQGPHAQLARKLLEP
jgi:TolA-binding protein